MAGDDGKRQREANAPWSDELQRAPAEVELPEGSVARGTAVDDERRAGTPGVLAPPEATTDRDAVARQRMAGAHGGPGSDRSLTGGRLPTMVSGSQREGLQRGSMAGVPEGARPLADEGQGRD